MVHGLLRSEPSGCWDQRPASPSSLAETPRLTVAQLDQEQEVVGQPQWAWGSSACRGPASWSAGNAGVGNLHHMLSPTNGPQGVPDFYRLLEVSWATW